MLPSRGCGRYAARNDIVRERCVACPLPYSAIGLPVGTLDAVRAAGLSGAQVVRARALVTRGFRETPADGSNRFMYSRFLTPHPNGYDGWAIFADGDMICRADIAQLWAMRDPRYAVRVVKHDYRTRAAVKYLANRNDDYPRRNGSSVILWNCGHPVHRVLTPAFIQQQPGSYLHRFSWIDDALIGERPREWHRLALEYPDNPAACLIHNTLGTPCFRDYADGAMARPWHETWQCLRRGFDHPDDRSS